eukprot:TRINITY_DN54050_c0_g1_i1.p1 TRINITY_DN54050_c0_g1~~TRINITY_DN54050_c0_g1_i1.p1  ORF type:complete len:409 (-),score=42.95 TRINITY_DN54050_c0_g1_i1:640-1866(-)
MGCGRTKCLAAKRHSAGDIRVLSAPLREDATAYSDNPDDLKFKVAVLGDVAVGKTCLVHRLSTGSWLSSSSCCTLGLNVVILPLERFLGRLRALVREEYAICCADFEALSLQNAKIQLMDTSGQARFHDIRSMVATSADVVIYCIDPAYAAREDLSLEDFLESISSVVQAMKKPRFILVLTKTDVLVHMPEQKVENIREKFDGYYKALMPIGVRRAHVSCLTGDNFSCLEGELMFQLKDAAVSATAKNTRVDGVTSLKAITIGPVGVGKTTFCHLAAEGGSCPSVQNTIGVDYWKLEIAEGSRRVIVNLIDTAGMERNRSLPSQYFRGAGVIFAVWDMSRPGTLDETRAAVEKVPWDAGASIFYIGMKKDIAETGTRVKVALCMSKWAYDWTEGERVQADARRVFLRG